MSLKLTERSRVKDLTNIGRTDTLWDSVLDGMIEQASLEVESYTQRSFTKRQRTEYHVAYDQMIHDPTPQTLLLKAYPVDPGLTFRVIYARQGQHSTNGIEILSPDYLLDAEFGALRIFRMDGLSDQVVGLTGATFEFDPIGFQVVYTGGYAADAALASPPISDPLDDYDLVQAPVGLRSIIASKIAGDWKEGKILTPWKPEQLEQLQTYRKRS